MILLEKRIVLGLLEVAEGCLADAAELTINVPMHVLSGDILSAKLSAEDRFVALRAAERILNLAEGMAVCGTGPCELERGHSGPHESRW